MNNQPHTSPDTLDILAIGPNRAKLKQTLEHTDILSCRYISETSPEYREQITKAHSSKLNFFGQFSLSEHQRITRVINNIKESGGDMQPFLNQLGELFDFPKRKLISFFNGKYDIQKKIVSNFFNEILEDEGLTKELEALSNKKILQHEEVAKLFEQNKIKDELFIKMLKIHEKNFLKKNNEFQQQAEIYREEYKQRVKEEIESGYLPIKWEVAERRINETKFKLVDSAEFGGEIEGLYSNWTIEIGDTIPKSEWKHNIFHEMTHAISGRVIREKIFDDRNWQIPLLENAKLGMHFQSRKKINGFSQHTFKDLNEALTEEVTLKLLGRTPIDNKEGKIWRLMERSELNRFTSHLKKVLIEQDGKEFIPDETDIDMKLFLEAYFESFEPVSEDEKPHLPKCEELFEQIKSLKGEKELESLRGGVN